VSTAHHRCANRAARKGSTSNTRLSNSGPEMIWWILLLSAAFGVVVAVGHIRAERDRRERAEREIRRLKVRHPGSHDAADERPHHPDR
ncbi:hypothetical protein RZS08_59970, partial [Arthrospira platensis SPKY1]|nr:hypothetical protein [Arthrospira platensis SPKY1]